MATNARNNCIHAYKLRNIEILNLVPGNKPGYYKWWAQKGELQAILDKLDISFCDVEEYLEERNGWYCIYVGVAIKESVQARLNWHVNQTHNPTNVQYGTLSTFRQTISSVVGSNMLDTQSTNDFIDKLVVAYYACDFAIKSQEAKEHIRNIEKELLNSNTLYLLNIQDNHHKLAPRKKLTALRKQARQI